MNVLWCTLLAVYVKIISVYGYKGVCTRVESYTQVETYYRDVPRKVTYKGFFPWSRKSKWITETYPATRSVFRTRTQYGCCAGYLGIYPHCQPTCSSGCINGKCTDPEICTCNSGYRRDVSKSNICNPVCLGGCENGVCTAPYKCTCSNGYELDADDRCVPVCESKCLFGKCIAPNKCECWSGYDINAMGTACEPICLGGCGFGVCSAPGKCTCSEGYQIDENNQCAPVCDSGCPFGTCIAPSKCECRPGYDLNSLGTACEPICLGGCENGICSAPDECTCSEGYKSDANNHCVPVCDSGCPFGKCIAPNTCECQPGYSLTSSGIGCEPKCSEGCDHGFCYRPEMCVCHQGYLMGPGNKCEPACSHGCINGICTEPEICSCSPGYRMPFYSVNRCEPVCEPECQNSDCFEPGVCICWMDYVPINKTSCEPYCSEECFHGYCSEPNNCTCHEGYEAHDYVPNVCTPVCDNCDYGDCISPGHCLCWPGYEMKADGCYLTTETTESGSSIDYTDETTALSFLSPEPELSESPETSSSYGEENPTFFFQTTAEDFRSTTYFAVKDVSEALSSTSDSVSAAEEVSELVVPFMVESTIKEEEPLEESTTVSQPYKLLHCNCWLLSFATFNSSHPGGCTPDCNDTNEALPCIDQETCEVDTDRRELHCNGTIYLCRSFAASPSSVISTRNWLFWVLLVGILVVSASGILFAVRYYRYRASAIICEKSDSTLMVQYVQ